MSDVLTIDCDDCGRVVAIPRTGSSVSCGCAGVTWSLTPKRADADRSAIVADRDEWRALARELGAALEQANSIAGRLSAQYGVRDFTVRDETLLKLREKEERDAGR